MSVHLLIAHLGEAKLEYANGRAELVAALFEIAGGDAVDRVLDELLDLFGGLALR